MQIVEKACSTLENFNKEFQKIKETNSMDADQNKKLVDAKKALLFLVMKCKLYITHTEFKDSEEIHNINLKDIEKNLFKNNIVDTENFKSLAEEVCNTLDLLDQSIEKDNSIIIEEQVTKKKIPKFLKSIFNLGHSSVKK